ncbi:MAG: tRNA (adenosine(37)-N6)-threonylcarbamoyltransferase complex ATPase subunit type 1 TsaE [Bacteroidetes bacterium]|nr:tRNA (adenosine(37)-N6)-threonylcarbamoyltransferase complex ATPase subunit type 1 TsaE [Bacteroidota bacterium]
MKTLDWTIRSEEDWDIPAEFLAQALKPGDLMWLFGSMGVGKTTLVQRICKFMGCMESIQSPSFAIMNQYLCKGTIVYHADLYRIEHEDELWDTGIYPLLDASSGIFFVEWPQRIPERIRAQYEPAFNANLDLLPDYERSFHLILPER